MRSIFGKRDTDNGYIYNAIIEKDRVSVDITKNKWRLLNYENAKYSGRLVCANAKCTPEPLTLKLDAYGRYKIYIGMMQLRGDPTVAALRLSNTEEISHISAITTYSWTPLTDCKPLSSVHPTITAVSIFSFPIVMTT